MFSKELELSISQAYQEAREKRHEYLTVEHMLLALLDNASALSILSACGADVAGLEKDLRKVLDDTVPLLPEEDNRDTQPTIGFQRVLQRALYHVQSAGKEEVLGANVLVAIFSEKDSYANYLLNRYDVTRLDVVNYISHGISKLEGEGGAESDASVLESDEEGGERKSSALEQFTTNLNQRARDGQIDPLIGREKEIQRTVQVLCRRRKN
ncbi:MAG: ATP-dependent Clp protease ATP-binding subunit ClpA, partial [Xanthomonadales bacterium]|nr:ATP-dependent Clp protease ATP-binding subunit ClpA [Xanthomonadales bacterium]